MNWYKVSMSADQVANGMHMKLQNEFEKLFMAANGPRDMALFSTSMGANRTLKIYFSPLASDLAKYLIDQYGGVACKDPESTKDIALLVGHADAKDRLL